MKRSLAYYYLFSILCKKRLDPIRWVRICIILRWKPQYVSDVAFHLVQYNEFTYMKKLFATFSWKHSTRNIFSENLLICAAKCNSYECLCWLLKNNIINVNSTDYFGRYALYFVKTYNAEFELLWYGSKFTPYSPWYYSKISKLRSMNVDYHKAKKWILSARYKWFY